MAARGMAPAKVAWVGVAQAAGLLLVRQELQLAAIRLRLAEEGQAGPQFEPLALTAAILLLMELVLRL